MDVSIAHGAIGFESGLDACPSTIVSVEAARFHGVADRWVESAIALFCHSQSKLHHFVQKRAHRNGNANLCRESHHFALSLEARATLLDPIKPSKCTLSCLLAKDLLLRIRPVADHFDRHERSHQRYGAAVDVVIHLLWIMPR